MPPPARLRPHTLARYLRDLAPLKAGFDLVHDHVIITDPDGRILYANAAAVKNTGYAHAEMLGKTPGQLWGGHMPTAFYQDLWRQIKIQRQPFVGEVKNVRSDGTEVWQELHISPVLDLRGQVKFFIGLEPNITDRKQREQFREEFLSILGHQSLTPLTSTAWALEWLLARGSLTREQTRHLRAMYHKNQGLIHLIEDVLFLARLGKGHPTVEPVDLAAEIRQMVAGLQARYPAVTFSFRPRGKFTLVVNPPLARQIFSNLLTNAAAYADPRAGRVVVTLQRFPARYVFCCRDNGIGIPAADHPKVFTKFFRAANARARNTVGAGLGLFVAKMIADNYGWTMTFSSQPKTGTTFTVAIPLDWQVKS